LRPTRHPVQTPARRIPRYRWGCGVRRQGVRGTHLQPCNDPASWYAAADTPRPRVGEQPRRPRRRV